MVEPLFNANILAPLLSVESKQREGRSAYVALQGNKLVVTQQKSQAASLKALSEQFVSDESGSLGDQIKKGYDSSLPANRWEAHCKLSSMLFTMEERLEERRSRISFKIMETLSHYLPRFFKSPETALQEKLVYLENMQAFLDMQEKRCEVQPAPGQGQKAPQDVSPHDRLKLAHERGMSLSSLPTEQLLNLLVERDKNGKSLPCSNQQILDIVETLKSSNNLALLNTIPNSRMNDPVTPLQYWAKKGNLQAVKILMRHGAKNSPTPRASSALFLASIWGQADVVKFMLKNGARVTSSPESDNRSFIPAVVYKMTYGAHQVSLESLRTILDHLKDTDPETLKVQLNMPIREKQTPLDIVEERLDSRMKDPIEDKSGTIGFLSSLRDLLISFGARRSTA